MAKKVIYILVFFLMVLMPLCFSNYESGYTSTLDNRELMDFPALEDGFPANFELYLQDRIGFRNELIKAYETLNDKLFGELSHPTYTYGKDKYVFLKQHDNIEYNEWHREFAEMVSKMQIYCESRGTPFYFMLEPAKSTVMQEVLPSGQHYNDEWVNSLYSYMNQLGINYIDNRTLLTEKNKQEPVFNKQYDAAHWNDLGAFYGTNNLLCRVNKDIPYITPLESNEYSISSKLEPFLPNSEFRIDEQVPSFETKINYTDITGSYKEEVEINPHYRGFQYLTAPNQNMPRVLFFQGSYYNGRPQFMINRASDYIAVHNYQNVMDLDYYYNIFRPDIVIFEAAEYTLTDEFFDSARMQEFELNPSLSGNSGIDSADNTMPLYSVLASASEKESSASLKIIEGTTIDRLFLNQMLPDAKYAYIISENNVYDAKVENGYLRCACEHGKIAYGNSVTLYYTDSTGNAHFSIIKAEKARKAVPAEQLSKHVKHVSSGKYTFSTSLGNEFNAINIQVYSEGSDEDFTVIDSHDTGGSYKGLFDCTSPKGRQHLVIRANSNKRDECIDYTINTVSGTVCYYEYTIDLLRKKAATIVDISIYI